MVYSFIIDLQFSTVEISAFVMNLEEGLQKRCLSSYSARFGWADLIYTIIIIASSVSANVLSASQGEGLHQAGDCSFIFLAYNISFIVIVFYLSMKID